MCERHPNVRAEVHSDLRHPKHYQVMLTGPLPLNPYEVGVALEKLGYRLVDNDQFVATFIAMFPRHARGTFADCAAFQDSWNAKYGSLRAVRQIEVASSIFFDSI